jgi:hypothetical protein
MEILRRIYGMELAGGWKLCGEILAHMDRVHMYIASPSPEIESIIIHNNKLSLRLCFRIPTAE